MRWSLITVTYNSERDLNRFWSGVSPAGSELEWIVVDNASVDRSADVAESLGARVIRLETNLGFGAANNVGFESASGKYVAFVNPDVEVDANDFVRLEEYLNSNEKALVSPQLTNPDGSLQPNGRGMPYLAYKVLNRLRPDSLVGRYLLTTDSDEVIICDWLMGAVVAGTRPRLAELGPWDPRFFVYYEDSDLGLRNQQHGGHSAVLGSARWVHGWARETKTASMAAWRREIPSLMKFYSRYPRLLGVPRATQERSI